MTSPILPVGQSASSPASATTERAQKVHQAAAQFETILVKQLLRAAKMGGDLKGGYGDMAVDALADGVEKGGGLGLADRIAQVLGNSGHNDM